VIVDGAVNGPEDYEEEYFEEEDFIDEAEMYGEGEEGVRTGMRASKSLGLKIAMFFFK